MKVWLLRLASLAVIGFQVLWVMQFRNYAFPKSSEWLKAHSVWDANPSSEKWEELRKQDILNGQRNRRNDDIVNGLLIVADIVIVAYFSWSWLTKMDERGTIRLTEVQPPEKNQSSN